ncbi:hypothetical protein K435DRAFT_861794 [Dendrothele bispora CBS 962.96]|uniref:Uncharacterized protein n=1 Tax=Dendrothele bispora (strain CBS 962.96) TaxID=1314807 RepID=A0A4V6T5C2_DENBC|nr:hypothetical protein K435DRAFT_861794 [Dendrothele bispora CBS 962.96]
MSEDEVFLTGQAEIELLLSRGVTDDELPGMLAWRKKLRQKYKKRLSNAQNYAKNRDKRLVLAREANARRRTKYEELSQEQKDTLKENHQWSQYCYRKKNRTLLADKERQCRMRKKAEAGVSLGSFTSHIVLRDLDICFLFFSDMSGDLPPHYAYTGSTESSDNDSESDSSIEMITEKTDFPWRSKPLVMAKEMQWDWDWVLTGKPPRETSWKTGWRVLTLSQPPSGRAAGKEWLHGLFKGQACISTSLMEQEYMMSILAVFLVRDDIRGGHLHWDHPPSGSVPLPDDTSEELWCRIQAERAYTPNGPLPSFSGVEVETRRIATLQRFEILFEDLQRAQRSVMNLIAARDNLVEPGQEIDRGYLLTRAIEENNRRATLQVEFNRTEIVVKDLLFLTAVALEHAC